MISSLVEGQLPTMVNCSAVLQLVETAEPKEKSPRPIDQNNTGLRLCKCGNAGRFPSSAGAIVVQSNDTNGVPTVLNIDKTVWKKGVRLVIPAIGDSLPL